jgi:hypothetical protein
MSEYDRQQRGQTCEGWAFTFCKAAFLVLIFGKFSLLALSGLAAVFYVAAQAMGVQKWRCWAKPPWVTLFWGIVFAGQIWLTFFQKGPLPVPHFPAG